MKKKVLTTQKVREITEYFRNLIQLCDLCGKPMKQKDIAGWVGSQKPVLICRKCSKDREYIVFCPKCKSKLKESEVSEDPLRKYKICQKCNARVLKEKDTFDPNVSPDYWMRD